MRFRSGLVPAVLPGPDSVRGTCWIVIASS
jgi:hypothetical protein